MRVVSETTSSTKMLSVVAVGRRGDLPHSGKGVKGEGPQTGGLPYALRRDREDLVVRR